MKQFSYVLKTSLMLVGSCVAYGMELPQPSATSSYISDIPETTEAANQELFKAIRAQNIPDVITLLSDADLDSRNGFGRTPLHWAAEMGNHLLVQLLLNAGAPINARDENGSSALHIASELGTISVVRELLNRTGRVNVNFSDVSERTPLHYAVLQEDPLVVRALINARALIDAQDIDGATPLHDAAAFGTAGILQALIQSIPASALNTPDNRGRTPLLVALENGNSYAVGLLLALDTHVNVRDIEGASALDYAILYPDKTRALHMLKQLFARQDLIIPDDLAERVITMTDDQDLITFILQRIKAREVMRAHLLRQHLQQLQQLQLIQQSLR
jgi:ankyrin repeat protein